MVQATGCPPPAYPRIPRLFLPREEPAWLRPSVELVGDVEDAKMFTTETTMNCEGRLPNEIYATDLHDAAVSMTATFTEGEERGDELGYEVTCGIGDLHKPAFLPYNFLPFSTPLKQADLLPPPSRAHATTHFAPLPVNRGCNTQNISSSPRPLFKVSKAGPRRTHFKTLHY